MPAVYGSRQKPGADRTEQLPLRRHQGRSRPHGPEPAAPPRNLVSALGRQPRTRASSAFWLAAPAPHIPCPPGHLRPRVVPPLSAQSLLTSVTRCRRSPLPSGGQHVSVENTVPLVRTGHARGPAAHPPSGQRLDRVLGKPWPLQPHVCCAPQWQSDGRGPENWATQQGSPVREDRVGDSPAPQMGVQGTPVPGGWPVPDMRLPGLLRDPKLLHEVHTA